jgi:hypothetical protein
VNSDKRWLKGQVTNESKKEKGKRKKTRGKEGSAPQGGRKKRSKKKEFKYNRKAMYPAEVMCLDEG